MGDDDHWKSQCQWASYRRKVLLITETINDGAHYDFKSSYETMHQSLIRRHLGKSSLGRSQQWVEERNGQSKVDAEGMPSYHSIYFSFSLFTANLAGERWLPSTAQCFTVHSWNLIPPDRFTVQTLQYCRVGIRVSTFEKMTRFATFQSYQYHQMVFRRVGNWRKRITFNNSPSHENVTTVTSMWVHACLWCE